MNQFFFEFVGKSINVDRFIFGLKKINHTQKIHQINQTLIWFDYLSYIYSIFLKVMLQMKIASPQILVQMVVILYHIIFPNLLEKENYNNKDD